MPFVLTGCIECVVLCVVWCVVGRCVVCGVDGERISAEKNDGMS